MADYRENTEYHSYRRDLGELMFDGNAVRQTEEVIPLERPVPERREKNPRRKTSTRPVRRNRARHRRMTLPYVIMLTAASLLTAGLCFQMLRLESGISASRSRISTLQENVRELSTANDAIEDEIAIYTDLDYIYKVATKKLGMVYPSDDQVILYDQTESEYVRQYEDIPTDD